MKSNIFERITNQIVEAIEAGAPDYSMPWHQSGKSLDCPTNAITGRAYRGLNVVTLWMDGLAAGFQTGQWATYRQWNETGAQVRKGERGTQVFFWHRREQVHQADGKDKSGQRKLGFIAKAFTVFNADQVTGYNADPVPELSETERLAGVEAFVTATGAIIGHGGDSACYIPSSDTVRMPEFKQFKTPEAYYSVLCHELTHWAGAKHRLNRQLCNRFGSQAYAIEELVALSGQSAPCLTHH
ncbi:MAG: ArdC family protein [Novosphingobium sp.]|uniref:ArdC family protein n=1 Tax=Novosphingobium sp. TaxID=1874826 RepID=UPI003B9B79EB